MEISVINQSLYYICGFAVPAFFMSTGYVLLNRSTVSKKYSCNKVKKILQVVLLWSLLISITYLFVHAMRNQLNFQSLLVLPETFIGGLVQRGNLWQFWYLGALIIIYIVYPILMRYRERLSMIWIISVIIGVLIQTASYFIGTPLQSHIIQTFRVWTWIQYFVLGGLIGCRQNNKEKVSIRKRAAICVLLTILIVAYQNVMGKFFLHNSYAEFFYDSILTIMWLISIFNFILIIELNYKVKRIIQYIVPLTMGIYIIHPLVIRVIQHFVVVDTLSMSFLLFFIVFMVSAICVCIMKKVPFVKQLIEL